jgi:dGTP triphosphohydrolase
MSVEDLLVADLKANRLGALIGDEEALAKLAKRAINEALFKEREEYRGSGYSQSTVKLPSPVMQAAQDVCKAAIDKLMTDMIAEMLDNPETMKIVKEAIAGLLPSIIIRHVDMTAMELYRRTQADTIQKLATAFMQSGKMEEANVVMKANEFTGLGEQRKV